MSEDCGCLVPDCGCPDYSRVVEPEIIRRIDTGSLELWDLYQDVKRLQDLLSAYNLGLQVVDKLSNTVIELQFDVTLEDG